MTAPERRYKFTAAWGSYSRISKRCLARRCPTRLLRPSSLVHPYLFRFVARSTNSPASDDSPPPIRWVRQRDIQGPGNRARKSRNDRWKGEARKEEIGGGEEEEEAHPQQKLARKRDHVFVRAPSPSPLSSSPSWFGTLAKTLLRFKSVPFGKVPTLPCGFSRNISPITGNISRGLHRFSLTPAFLSRETCQRIPLQKLHCESIQDFYTVNPLRVKSTLEKSSKNRKIKTKIDKILIRDKRETDMDNLIIKKLNKK